MLAVAAIWSEWVKPVIKSDKCQGSHIGYVVSGTGIVKMDDETRKTFTQGVPHTIPPSPTVRRKATMASSASR
ncbi:hypothetical protein MPLB_1570009 [Mesorhizobium sp. ORS 3324]|nr:hypothetical protein MPLB_1570009 [Mesorhizobium sp. ORS 3324]